MLHGLKLHRMHLHLLDVKADRYFGERPQNGGVHRVYMYFVLRDGWHCQFLEADLKTPLPKKLFFTDPQKITQLARRGGYRMNLEGR
jgi:hypothetical protein